MQSTCSQCTHLSRQSALVHVPLHEVGGVAFVVTTDESVSVVHACTVDCKPTK